MSLHGMAVPIRSWTRIRNSGDAITAFLVSDLFGGLPYQADANTPHVLGSGSILFMASAGSCIWGSGVLNQVAHLPSLVPQQIRALRGRLSADFLVRKGVHPGHIPFGDPGIFAADLLGHAGHVASPRYRVAIVPHHDSMNHPVFQSAASRPDVCVVDILNDSLEPMRQIADADVVVSQSLHGLIYAESLGKPSLWISHRSDDVWRFKFDDWFSTTYNPQAEPASMDTDLDSLIGTAELRYSSIRKADLLSAFPVELAEPRDPDRMDFQSCRAMPPPLFFYDDHGICMAAPCSAVHHDQMQLLATRLETMRSAVFSHWAEKTYCVAASMHARRIPSARQCKVIVAELDKRASVDYAICIPRLADLPDRVGELPLPDGVVLYQNLRTSGQVFVLRPLQAPLSGNYAVFGL